MPEDALNELDRGFGETEARGERKVLSVSALTKRVAQRLAEDWVLQDVAVRGELSNFVHHSSGHMYFSLKDAGSQLRCVMFRRENAALRFKPANGMDVVAHGYVGVYETRGEYQLYVRSLEPGGVGAL
ncbi:MAG: exodeoxyribonuclease VII large subunit, partial [Armatimonadetes bacterium]|nr:exodeoxyribonuclease VII large subunit [Armatimonadota bacterium]